MRKLVATIAVLLLPVLCGCPPPQPQMPPRPRVPRSLPAILETINSNAERVDRPLFASPVRVVADVVTSSGRSHRFNLEGSLLIRKPDELRLDLRYGLGSEQVMQVAANPAEYWAWILPEVSTYWWGRREHLGKECVASIPVRPEQLAEVLGFNPLPTNTSGLVGPAQSFEDRFDCLLYMRPRDGAYRLDRKYSIDPQPPHLVRRVDFLDEFGRSVMHAEADDFAPAWPNGPTLARRIRVVWPASSPGGGRSSLEMNIAAWRESPRISRRAFARPIEPPAGIERTIQVDEACDDSALPPPATSRPQESSAESPSRAKSDDAPPPEEGAPAESDTEKSSEPTESPRQEPTDPPSADSPGDGGA